MGPGNRPTPGFRREAVRLALCSERPRRDSAGDPGIGRSTPTRWVSRDRGAGAPVEPQADLHDERPRLRRENALLKQERAILKIAAVR
jgi:transposase